MSVAIHGYLMPPPWGPLWVRGDANLDPEDE
jgi:hypothetical protein